MARYLMEKDISNMPDPEFKATIIRILTVLEKSIEDSWKSLTTKTEELKTNQAKVKNGIMKS